MVEVLKFYADWCHPCHALAPIIEEVEKELGDKVTIKTIDADNDQKMVSTYSVMSLPTLVILKDGKEVDRIIGLTTKQTIVSKLTPHLA